jgi:predicted metalloprotease with PDZ domain
MNHATPLQAMGFVTEGGEHIVSQINPGGVADRAGLVVGDLIVKVSGIATSVRYYSCFNKSLPIPSLLDLTIAGVEANMRVIQHHT